MKQWTVLLLAAVSLRAADALTERMEQIAAAAEGRVGAAVALIGAPQVHGLRTQERFPMQSVYKFPIGMAVLHLVDQGKLRLDQPVRVQQSDYVGMGQHSPLRDKHPQGNVDVTVAELLRYTVAESDGSTSDVLLRLAGGSAGVMAYLKSIGVTAVMVRDTERAIGRDHAVQYRNWATPQGAVTLLRALQEGRGLTPASRSMLLKLMTETPTGMKRLKGELPRGTVVAHKTGTSRTVNGRTAATNDIGLITLPDGRVMAVAVFVSDAAADEAAREQVIAGMAKAAWDHFAAKSR